MQVTVLAALRSNEPGAAGVRSDPTMTDRERSPSPRFRSAGAACAAAIGLAGFVPLDGRVDPVRALVVLALWAAPAGWLAARTALGWAVPLVWCATVAVALGDLDRVPACLAIVGTYALGRGAASLGPRRADGTRPAGVATALLVTTSLALAPGLAGVVAEPWPTPVAARLLDVSPVVLVCESAGIDWMRRPGVYETVGCDRFPRTSFATSWTGGWVAAVGLALACLGELRRRRAR